MITPTRPLLADTPNGTAVDIIGGTYADHHGTFLKFTKLRVNVEIHLANGTRIIPCLHRNNVTPRTSFPTPPTTTITVPTLLANEPWITTSLMELCTAFLAAGIDPLDGVPEAIRFAALKGNGTTLPTPFSTPNRSTLVPDASSSR